MTKDPAARERLEQETAVLAEFLPQIMDAAAVEAALSDVADQIRAAGGDGPATGIAMKHYTYTNMSKAAREQSNSLISLVAHMTETAVFLDLGAITCAAARAQSRRRGVRGGWPCWRSAW